MKIKNCADSLRPLSSYTPGGSQTLSKMACRFPEVYPKDLERGFDGHVYSGDGRCFIDLIAGLGAISLGYNNREVNKAAQEQMEKGVIFSLPNQIEYKVAKRLTELVPGTDMWKFGKNGTDGTVMAVRAARAYTKRNKIISVGYHGCADVFEYKRARYAGMPWPSSDCMTEISPRYNEIESFLPFVPYWAAIIIEPMILEHPKAGFLEHLREMCTKSGTLLIFDEVVTGGRFENFTASSYFGVEPDLYVLGKGLANGFPICAVGGRNEIMRTFEREDFFASGTFGGECVSLAACLKTVDLLEESIKARVYKGSRIQEAFNKLPWKAAKCEGYPTRLSFQFDDPIEKAVFMQEMCFREVLLGSHNFIMASHTHEDVTKIIEAIHDSFNSMRKGAGLIGKLPNEAVVRKNG